MKTKNNIQKTVKSQMRKMVLRGSAVIVSLVLLSWSVSAQDFWKHFFAENSFGNIALLMNGQTSEFEKADALADVILTEINSTKAISAESFTMEAETEKGLEVESWMTNETFFSNNFKVAEEMDKDLKLEGWMIRATNSGAAMNTIQDETEQTLKVEDWMINEANFNSVNAIAEQDAELDLESWMVEDSIFTSKLTQQEEPLKFEAWMADTNFWGF